MASNKPNSLQATIDESDLTYVEFIDRGASGDVYHATWKSQKLGTVEVAAKKIPIRKGQNINALLANEIVYLQNLDHPNIIKYYGHVVTKDHVVIVTEYAAKGSLYDYLKDKKSLPSELKLKWAIQGARGIKYLQQNQVLHRDIKSPNLLVTADDDLKICDFGISKNLTSTKTTSTDKGTVRWLAPEAFTELQLSPTADIFAFGIVLWELETCQEPYPDMAPMTVMYKVGSEGLRPEIPATCSPVLRDLMQQCWDGDRAKRPEINEIIRQLQQCTDDERTKRECEVLGPGLEWRYKHTIDTAGHRVDVCDWISETHLAVCMVGFVQVYEVNEATPNLAYTLSSAEWYGKEVKGAAVSEALPSSILVICQYQPYVYQHPTHEASHEVIKYKIQSIKKGSKNPWCIAANTSVVIINMKGENSFILCHLPGFTHQYRVGTDCFPYDLTISSHYLLVMGDDEMVVKSTGDMNQTVCVMKPPHGWEFTSVSCRNNAREIYAACFHDVHEKYRVYKYTWNGSSKHSYVNAGCVVDDLRDTWFKCLSVTSGGLMAVRDEENVRIYSLE